MQHLSYRLSRSLFFIAFFALVISVWTFTPLREYASVEGVRGLAETYRDSWWVVAFFLALFAIGNMFLLPIPLIVFASSLVFSFWKSLAIGVAGISIASTLGYAMGRYIDMSHWPSKFRHFAEIIVEKLEGHAIWTIVLLRVAPTPPFTITSVIAGSCRFFFVPFLVGSILGVLPMMTLVNFFGVQILELIRNPGMVSGIGLLVVIGLGLIIFLSSKRSRRSKHVSLT